MQQHCNTPTEVYSRVAGYYRPVKQWNKGKQEEFKLRKSFSQTKVQDEERKVG